MSRRSRNISSISRRPLFLPAVLAYEGVQGSVAAKLLKESAGQLAALGARDLRWYFAEAEAAESVRKLFADRDEGRERIEIVALPWP